MRSSWVILFFFFYLYFICYFPFFFFFFFRCVCLTAMETNDFGRTDESRRAGKRKKWPHGITNIPTRSDSGIGRRLRTSKQNKRMDKLKHEVQRCAHSHVRFRGRVRSATRTCVYIHPHTHTARNQYSKSEYVANGPICPRASSFVNR